MYKSYSKEEYLRVADECSSRVKNALLTRYNELEQEREAINDRYPFEDLFLKYAEVDNETLLIEKLLEHLEICTLQMKDEIRHNSDK